MVYHVIVHDCKATGNAAHRSLAYKVVVRVEVVKVVGMVGLAEVEREVVQVDWVVERGWVGGWEEVEVRAVVRAGMVVVGEETVVMVEVVEREVEAPVAQHSRGS
jgi:hypothetical protein